MVGRSFCSPPLPPPPILNRVKDGHILQTRTCWEVPLIKKLTDVAIFQVILTLGKLQSGMSNLHRSRDKVDGVIDGDLLSRANAGVSFSFVPYIAYFSFIS